MKYQVHTSTRVVTETTTTSKALVDRFEVELAKTIRNKSKETTNICVKATIGKKTQHLTPWLFTPKLLAVSKKAGWDYVLGSNPMSHRDIDANEVADLRKTNTDHAFVFDVIVGGSDNFVPVFISHYDHSFYVVPEAKRYVILRLSYLRGNISNDRIDLDRALAHLIKKEDPRVYLPESTIKQIPYYNASRRRSAHFEFNYLNEIGLDDDESEFVRIEKAWTDLGLDQFKVETPDEEVISDD